MIDYLKQTLKTDLCLSFMESFAASSKDNYFLFLGKSATWDAPYDDNNPPATIDTLTSDMEAWRHMTALTRVNKSNVMVGAARYDWAYNTIFDQFDDSVDLYEEGNERHFYCITDEYNVYKCISNNYGTASTIAPTAVTPEEQITQDGYVWKFMFRVREELYEFLTDDFIPVEKLENILFTDERVLQNNVKIGATPSAIDNVLLYQYGGSYPLAIVSDAGDTESKHRFTQVGSTGEYTLFPSVDLDRTNDIYNEYYELYIAEGPGAGYKSVIIDYEVNVSDGSIIVSTEDVLPNVTTDSVYRIYPRVKLSGDGSGGSIIPIMNSEKLITGFTILSGGKNYHYATLDVYRKNPTYSNKTLGRVILSPLNGHGFDAIKELGCNMVMIYVPLRNAEKTIDPDASNLLLNDYRQIGLLKNAFYNNSEDLAPISSTESLKTYLELENVNSKSLINITSTQYLINILPVGTLIIQGSSSNLFQARGYVDSVDQTATNVYTVTITNSNGRFLSSSSTTYPLVKSESESEITGTINAVYITDLFDSETFLVDNYIIGTTTASTAKITNWICNPYGLSGKLYYSELKGKFRNSYYARDTDGNIVLVRGERVVGYASIDTTTGQLEGTSPATVGIIRSIGTTEEEAKQFYKVTTTLKLVPSSGTLSTNLFAADDVVRNSDDVEGRVISYTFISTISAELEVTGLTGNFAVDDILTLVGDTDIATNARISQIILPEVLPYYGDIIYIQNTTPIVASNDAEEHIKIIIKF